jgi:hypothetical protein
MEIDAKSSSDDVGSRHTIGRFVLVTGAMLLATFLQLPHALSLDRERHATVNAGERVRLWFGANYGRRCASAGPPLFHLIAKPSLGEVITELADYTVPHGEHCAGQSYTGLGIWYKAGTIAGTDTFRYTLEFPHEPSNPTPSKGPQPVTVTIVVR